MSIEQFESRRLERPEMPVFLDRLLASSLLSLLPYAIRRKLQQGPAVRLQYFSASGAGRGLLGILSRLGLLTGGEADYSYVEVKDPSGADIGLRVESTDLLLLCRAVRAEQFEANPSLARLAERFDHSRLLLYLEKSLAKELGPVLMHINVVSWCQRSWDGRQPATGVFYVARTPWHRHLERYAAERGVVLRQYRSLRWSVRLAWKRLWAMARVFGRLVARIVADRGKAVAVEDTRAGERSPFTVAVPHTGFGLGFDLSQKTDLFWVPFVGLAPDQLLVYFPWVDDSLDESHHSDLRKASIRAVGIRRPPRAGSTVPVWPHPSDVLRLGAELRRHWGFLILPLVTGLLSRGLRRWVAFRLFDFMKHYLYWRWLFSSLGVKVHVANADWGRERVASDQAMADLGGLSISYQRSDEPFASIARSSSVDVHFVFSPASAEAERQSGSLIPQFVANGYVHDHAFALVRSRSDGLRKRLLARGASFIICLLDENSLDDKRRGPSHEFRGENYRYLLDRLLKDPTLGLVLKPKKAATLRRRLGPVAPMLDAALVTGRCVLFEQGVLATPELPCEASLASDVTIGLLFGATAAMESALAGTPTLLIDREMVTYHPLYSLGQEKVVFRDWDSLWETLTAYRRDPASVPGFGDWSSLLRDLDPFQDGRAAQRMGEYIGWLVQGLAQDLSRSEAMELARRRYVAIWGEDKVLDLRGDSIDSGPGGRLTPVESDVS